jgi:Zn-finger nucleic acid-binding protein
MKAKTSEIGSANELQLELKYCERCGGLWLRPTGGGQIYCVTCGREMAKMPAVSRERKGMPGARVPRGPVRWSVDDSEFENCEEYDDLDLDAAGGVA